MQNEAGDGDDHSTIQGKADEALPNRFSESRQPIVRVTRMPEEQRREVDISVILLAFQW